MAAQRIPAVRAAVQVLADEGVEIVFGCPGAALLPLCTAMTEAGGIERLPARHPEGALHMAHGWARRADGPVSPRRPRAGRAPAGRAVRGAAGGGPAGVPHRPGGGR
ncbi:thiamine pyrophosphate-binding protein [Streptomyces angustmyceticus]|uniref:thiamine pyrophosphate-binding protein n=1 Tax=Streptomyces angustmyceticus TaxID=285578 RepID=UPI0028BEC14B|nr:thiamine pyrophosphate-binding protein [Streptomyces angustmyceticus]